MDFDKMVKEATRQYMIALIITPIIVLVLGCIALLMLIQGLS